MGQGARSTGFARVLRTLWRYLRNDFDIVHFALDYRGDPRDEGYTFLPNVLPGDIYGRDQLPGLLDRFHPDIVLLCHDYGFYSIHEEALVRWRRRHAGTRVTVYCPIEWDATPAGNLASLRTVDQLVLYTGFGRRVVEEAFRALGEPPPQVSVIPHGVDCDLFKPLVAHNPHDNRREARRRLGFSPELDDAFIVLNANRNVPRKRIDLTLDAFARFAADKPDTFLYLHMGLQDSGFEISRLAQNLGIDHRLLLTTREPGRPQVPDDHLNLIYNACQVGLNTSTGEGWGLVAFEHAATGGAQVVPAHSACAELWNECGTLVALEEISNEPGRVSPADAARCLDLLYREPGLLSLRSTAAMRHARSERFSWRRIARQWAELLAAPLLPPLNSP